MVALRLGFLVAFAAFAAGCPGRAAPGPRARLASKRPAEPRTGPTPADRPIGFTCAAPRCMVHPRTGAYHQCLHAGAGTCFGFGAPCTPSDGCLLDPAARQYKRCTRPLVGGCAEWGEACSPSDRCMLDPAAGRYRHCDAPSPGGCARYGATCEPG